MADYMTIQEAGLEKDLVVAYVVMEIIWLIHGLIWLQN